MISSETFCRVLYAHTDKMGIVNNARYLEYFEAGRNDLLRGLGVPYTELEKMNVGLPVIEAGLKYLLPAGYDNMLKVVSSIRSLPTVRFKIDYEVKLGDSVVVTGFTVHSFINLSTLRPVRPPEFFLDLIKSKLNEEH